MGPSFLQSAIDLLDQGQPAEAIQALRPLTQRFPNYPSPFILLARAYEAEGNWKAATATWQHVNGLVAESPVIAAGMKRGRARLARQTLQPDTAPTQQPAPLTPAPTEETSPEAGAPRAWEWPEGLINEYAELRDPDAEVRTTPSAMPDSPVVKKLLARLTDPGQLSPAAPASSLHDVETPAPLDQENASAGDTPEGHHEPEATGADEADEVADAGTAADATEVNATVPRSAGAAIAADVLDEANADSGVPEPHADDLAAPPSSRVQELTALLDAPNDEVTSTTAAPERQTTLAFDGPAEDEAAAPRTPELIAEPEPLATPPAASVPDPMVEMDAVFAFDPDSTTKAPTATDLSEGYDDLDALIESLEGARIRPRPDLDDIPPPDLDDDIDDVVSETLARIYAGQRKYEEAARVYEKLAEQQPERATEFTEKAALVRGRSR